MVDVSLTNVEERVLAVGGERVPMTDFASRFRPVLDHVWAVVGARGFVAGHNVFLYRPDAGTLHVELGVEVEQPFDDADDVVCTRTPAGRAATAVHVGPYDRLGETHDAVVAWCAEQRVTLTGIGWEVYGDWDDDPARLRTDVFHQVA